MGIPLHYYLFAIGIGGIVGLWRRDWIEGLLAGYLIFVLAITLLIREAGDVRYRITLFWSWRRIIQKWAKYRQYSLGLLRQIILNVVMFIPVGFLLSKKGKWAVPISSVISVAIELIQLITGRGLFEFDDIIHNTLGAVIGFGICVLLRKVMKNDF